MNKKCFKIVGFFVLAILLIQGGWCLAAQKAPIKIGLISAVSSPVGKSNKASMEIGVKELNKAGGILGRPVQLIVEDSKREVPLVVSAYKKLVISEKCLAVFTEGTEASMAGLQEAVRLYPEYPHLLFTLYTSTDEVTDNTVCKEYDKYKFIFRPHTKCVEWWDPKQCSELFTNTMGTKKMALIIEEMAWTDSFVKGRSQKGLLPLRDAFQKRGIEVVYFAQNAVGEKMFLPIFEKVAASGADTIYWMTGYTDTITVTKQWAVSAAKDVDLAMVGGAASYANFWNMTGGVALGVINFMPEIPVPYTDKTLPFLKELNAMGAGLLQSTFPAYDTPWVLKAVIEKVRKVEDMDGIIKSLEKTEVQYGSFIWKWGKCHDAIKGYPYFPHTYGQFQGPGKLAMIFPEGVRELVNPNDKFIRVKELRKRAGLK